MKENPKETIRKEQNYIPWNKENKGYTLNVNRKGKRHSSKITREDVLEIRSMYDDFAPSLPGVQVIQKKWKGSSI